MLSVTLIQSVVIQAAAARLADRFDEYDSEESAKNPVQNGKPSMKPLRGKRALRAAIEHILKGYPYGGLPPNSRCALLRILVDASLRTTIVRY